MSLDQIGDPKSFKMENKARQHVNPFNHYEVNCNMLKTVFVSDEFQEAEAVYLDCLGSQKALIHVRGINRIVLTTNAPYMYLRDKLTKTLLTPQEA